MSVKTAAVIAGLVTFVVVILLSVLAGFMQMVAMNGPATGMSFLSMVTGMVLEGVR